MVLLVLKDFADEVTKTHDGGMTNNTLSASLRQAVDEELAPWDTRKLTNSEAAFLADDFPYATGSDAYHLAQAILRLRPKATPIAATDNEVQDPEVARFVWAKSLLIAIEAASHFGVEDFRRDLLDDKLLAPGQVADWIDAQAASDGPRTRYVIGIPILGGSSVPPLFSQTEVRVVGYSEENVEFVGDDGRYRNVPVARGGVLERLRQLADLLARTYPWQPAQASTFVLTGATPVVRALRRTMPRLDDTDRRLITFEIDPDVPVDFLGPWV
jgi:hypothetical protein